MLPGGAALQSTHWRWERRQLIPHVRFQVPFLGPENQLKSGFAFAGVLCSNSICLLLKVHFFEVFCIKVAKAQRFGFNEAFVLTSLFLFLHGHGHWHGSYPCSYPYFLPLDSPFGCPLHPFPFTLGFTPTTLSFYAVNLHRLDIRSCPFSNNLNGNKMTNAEPNRNKRQTKTEFETNTNVNEKCKTLGQNASPLFAAMVDECHASEIRT